MFRPTDSLSLVRMLACGRAMKARINTRVVRLCQRRQCERMDSREKSMNWGLSIDGLSPSMNRKYETANCLVHMA